MFEGKTTAQLTETLKDFCIMNGLSFVSADELHCEGLTETQASWVADFIIAWDDQQRREDRERPKNAVAFVVRLRTNAVIENGEALRRQVQQALENFSDELGFDGSACIIEVDNTHTYNSPLDASERSFLDAIDKASS